MIHHSQIASGALPRATIPRAAEAPRPYARHHWVGMLSGLFVLLTLAASLGAQAPASRGAPAAAPDTGGGWRGASWTADRRGFVVGDIIRVNVDEYTLASANKGDVNTASRGRKMDVGISPPSTGATAMGNIDGSEQTSDAGETRARGDATRGNRYIGEIPVRVIAVTPEGLLQIKGTKLIDVDKNKQEMTISGFVRPQDVNSRDVVASNAIADAQLSYNSNGGLGKPKNGIITKILGIFWP
jgi:flagellar L-ring protein precursor FlgH